ncbi:4-hydroxybenzoate octaprenyltransferase [Candidatus Photodesmus blepharus]|uniref:4-hydroxybenzoate octaprenyltransferase n=2 Tax=Candidatus Photodesmus blepharonis TaxID=1179155 RepID=A0A084CNI1_9GAMM|nr:4-hydroxybenzoate octaprenyltransferase [Candidatus Photodesmus blepharus]
MDRPIGLMLLIWPTLWSLIIASEGKPKLSILVIFIVGAILMRSAGCVINDLADRKIDGYVKRTRDRPIPSGLVSTVEAIFLFFLLSIFSFFLIVNTMNALTVKLSFIGIILVCVYPFMKRFTHLSQLFLGLTFSWSIPMAWAAETNELSMMVWYIFTINFFWTVAYDTQYAMVDRDDDLKVGVKSTAILFAHFDRMIVGGLQLIIMIMLIMLGIFYEFVSYFYWILFIIGVLFIFQQRLIKDRKRENCFKAFLNNNYVGISIMMALLIAFHN